MTEEEQYVWQIYKALSKMDEDEHGPFAAFRDVANELQRAMAKFAPMNSAHEGYAVIAEELDELWDEVRNPTQHHDNGNPIEGKRNVPRMRKEAIQVAAMAIRFVIDVCDGGRGQR